MHQIVSRADTQAAWLFKNKPDKAISDSLLCLLSNGPAKALEILRQLIEVHGMDVNSPSDGVPPLSLASNLRAVDVMVYLLSVSGIDINTRTGNCPTALVCACSDGHLKMVQLLLAHPGHDVDAMHWHPKHFCLACMSGHIEVAKALLNHETYRSAKRGLTAASILGCCFNVIPPAQRVNALRLLLDDPMFDVNAIGKRGRAAIHVACSQPAANMDLCFQLIDCPRVNINIRSRSGSTAWNWPAERVALKSSAAS